MCGGHGANPSTTGRGEGILERSQEGGDEHLLTRLRVEVGSDLPQTDVGICPDPRLEGAERGHGCTGVYDHRA